MPCTRDPGDTCVDVCLVLWVLIRRGCTGVHSTLAHIPAGVEIPVTCAWS